MTCINERENHCLHQKECEHPLDLQNSKQWDEICCFCGEVAHKYEILPEVKIPEGHGNFYPNPPRNNEQ